ncbi:fibronectin type III domain-containing protein [Porphyromonas macacae]|nr:fibronectin type III domain-containing protein [Porphyromonas macacae]
MMKKIVLALALGCLLIPKNLLAQEDKNLWYNPGFELFRKNHPEKLDRWIIPETIVGLKPNPPIVKDNPHGGKNCIEITPGGQEGRLGMYDKDWDFDQKYEAKDGDTFILSYWHRGNLSKASLPVEIRYYNAAGGYNSLGSKTIENSVVKPGNNWQKHTVVIKVSKSDLRPEKQGEEIAFIDIKLRLPSSITFGKKPGSIFLDDFSLVKKAVEPDVNLNTPVVKENAFQREIELSWSKEDDREVSFEVVVDGRAPITVKESHYILTGLTPKTSYKVKVRAVKGKHHSEYSRELNIKTDSFNKEDNDITRLPYLRTLNKIGTAPRTLNLFYYDLYNASANFTYWIDGVKVTPEGYQLKFPRKGKQELKILIDEGADKVWTLTYNLDVI